MEIILPGEPDVTLDAKSLKQVLGYSDQHRTVISNALKKTFLGQWPEERLSEDDFYEVLFGLLADSSTRENLLSSLSDLAMRKDKNKKRPKWALVILPNLRLIVRALEIAADRATAEEVFHSEGHEMLFAMLADEGHPELDWWHRWLQIHLSSMGKKEGHIVGEHSTDKPTLKEEWKSYLRELTTRANEEIQKPPSVQFTEWLQQRSMELNEIAQRYAEENDITDLIKDGEDLLQQVKSMAVPSLDSLITEADEALTHFQGQREILEAWMANMEQLLETFRTAKADEKEHKAAVEAALAENDYDKLSNHSTYAKLAHEQCITIQEQMGGLLGEISNASLDVTFGQSRQSDTSSPSVPADEQSEGACEGDSFDVDQVEVVEKKSGALIKGKDSNNRQSASKEIDSKEQEHPVTDDSKSELAEPHGRPEEKVAKKTSLSDEPSVKMVASSAGLQEEDIESDAKVEDVATVDQEVQPSIHIDADISSLDLAEKVRSETGNKQIQGARYLMWALIRDERIPLAYHIAKAIADKPHSQYQDKILPDLLRAIHIGDYLSSSAGEESVELADNVRRSYEVWLADKSEQNNKPMVLMVFAAVFRPVLIAPDTTGARNFLRDLELPLRGFFPALHPLVGQVLAPNFDYLSMLDLDSGSQIEELRTQAHDWWETNLRHKFKYEPATKAWRFLLSKDGALGRAASIILDGGRQDIPEAKKLLQQLHGQSAVEKIIRQADQEVRERIARRKPIEAGPRADMVKRCYILAELLSKWVDAFGERASSAYHHKREEVLQGNRKRFIENLESAQTQIGVMEDSNDLIERASGACAKAVLRDIHSRLEATKTRPTSSSMWWRTLNSVLLHSNSFVLKPEQWAPQTEADSDPLVALAELTDLPNWEVTFSTASSRCDHLRTAQILDWFRNEEKGKSVICDQLERSREQGLRRCEKDFEVEREEALDEVERATGAGYLDEEERARLVAELGVTSDQEIEDYYHALMRVRNVREQIGNLRHKYARDIQHRLEESGISEDNQEAYRRIIELLDVGDLLTASEYVALLEDGQPIPGPAQHRDPFKDEFFPEFVDRIQDYLGKSRLPVREIPNQIAKRGVVGPLQMRNVPGAQAKSAAELLRNWLHIKNRQGEFSDHLVSFLALLGFVDPQLKINRESIKGSERSFDLAVRTISDRDICVVPRYGSLARGQYRVLCIWDRPPEEEVLTSALASAGGRPVIVLYLGQLSAKRRRDLAFRSRERKQTVLVIDETLAYFLCGERGSRIATMFDCALPFTMAQPYITTSSDVPQELFFGRRTELEDVFDAAGTSLLYGGRQLGKTALLRAVVRRFHDPKHGVIVSWIDLKERHIGLSEPAVEVWQVIDRVLVQEGVLTKTRRGPDKTADAITRWLDEAPGRRIVMLLDESDAFLAQDAQDSEFRTVGTLKGLMERTGRRFKVVFAGLHNVQRTSRDINSPLAHFGKPVCIGPLLANGEAREAFQLVERPLRQLGFRFDSPSLVNRILAQTNYYPNLIQIFCAHLLNYLYDVGRVRFDPARTPPYPITREHIETASQNRELQQTIRSRFQITLDLDNRYQIVALVVALETQQRQGMDDDPSDGFDTEWIRQQALSWWGIGFADRSFDAFRALLDEMVGLGVLRRAGSDRMGYALRSPSLAGLLGGPMELEQALLEASEKEPPELYQAATYRRGRHGDPWVRSPLTGQQESDILAEKSGVAVLFGTALAGMDRLQEFLKEMVEDKDFVQSEIIEGAQDIRTFENQLRKNFEIFKKAEGTLFLVIPDTEPWTREWVVTAIKQVNKRRFARATYRVLFVGNPRDAWDWFQHMHEETVSDISLLMLSPWAEPFVGQWAKDAGFGPLSSRDLKNWGEVTGWWGGPMAILGERLRDDPAAWKRAFDEFREDIKVNIQKFIANDIPTELKHPLRILADYGEPLAEEEWLELLESKDAKELKRIIHWADMLNMLTPSEGGTWAIDHVVGHALK